MSRRWISKRWVSMGRSTPYVMEREAHRLFPGLFAARAAYQETAPALIDPTAGTRFSYGTLHERARRWAWGLARRGVGTETRVGVLLERSADLVTALLAVLEAGAAWVPLDPAWPRKRLRLLLEDVCPAAVLTRRQHLSLLDGAPARRAIDLAALEGLGEARRAAPSPARSPARPHPESAAYVLYTSGSTGRPKGVVVPHRALGWYCVTAGERYGLGPGDRVLQFAPPAFDVSVAEIFASLASGAAVVLRDAGAAGSAKAFFERLRAWGITVIFPATALWHELARAAAHEPRLLPPALRLVGLGTERLDPARVADWRRATAAAAHLTRPPRLLNLYGPTEGTVDATAYDLKAIRPATPLPAEIPIGRPVAGACVGVLDERLRRLPEGAVGQLALASPGLARGYLDRPAATAAKFVPHGAPTQPGQRLYLTGDRGRVDRDGALEFLGRLDRQVKIRGIRIEPGEVEAVLRRHPAVTNAAVVARREPSGEARLVAWMATGSELDAAEEEALAAELRRFAAARLPEPFVPNAFVVASALPLDERGKIDLEDLASRPWPRPRRRLEPMQEDPARKLAALFAVVLGLDEVAPGDDFFALGGDSILALRLASLASGQGFSFQAGDLFTHPTPAALLTFAGRSQPALERPGEPWGEVPWGEVPWGEVPLTPIQHWFFERRLPQPEHFNWTALYRPLERLEPALLGAAVARLVAHHDALRLRFTPDPAAAGGWRQHGSAPERPPPERPPPERPSPERAAAPLGYVDLAALPKRRRRDALEAAAARVQASFVLAAGPLFRVVLLGWDGEQRLLLTAHHLVVDAVSWAVLLEDLESVYLSLAQGRRTRLPPRTTSFRRWAELLVEQANGPQIRSELELWRTLGQPPAPDRGSLPPDDPSALDSVAGSITVTARLDARSTVDLLRRVPAATGARIDAVLLTALARALGRLTGRRELHVELEAHGREEIVPGLDLSRTVGWFTAGFPLWIALPDHGDSEDDSRDDPSRDLEIVQERLHRVPRHGVGWGILRYLSPLGERPAPPRIAFNYLSRLDAAFEQSSALLAPAPESPGPRAGRGGRRTQDLEINALVVRGQTGEELLCEWSHHRDRHRRERIEALATAFLEELQTLIGDALEKRRESRRRPARSGVVERYPLTPLQEGLLYHALGTPRRPVYLEQLSWSLDREIVPSMLRRAYEEVVARHPVLRTAFSWETPERPRQEVHGEVAVAFTLVDLRRLDAARQERATLALAAAERQHGFDLTRPGLSRFYLVDRGGSHARGRWRILWSCHHLILDGWSTPLLLDELFTLYHAGRRGTAPRLPERRPFRDYVAWLERQDTAAAEGFWRRQLAGLPAPPRWPFPATGPGTEAGRLRARLPASLVAALESVARRERLTLSTLAHAAWGRVLSRFFDRDDVVFGSTIAHRPAELAGAEAMVGLLINTLPVRLRFRDGEPRSAFLGRLQEELAAAWRHAAVSLARVQRAGGADPRRPLFETLLVFENYPTRTSVSEAPRQLELGDRFSHQRTHYPLTMQVVPVEGEGLALQASWERGRLSPTEARHFLLAMETELRRLAGWPESRSATALRHLLWREWSATASPPAARPPEAAVVHELFLRQATAQPGAVAVVDASETLTYGELASRAAALARRLVERGVDPESTVALVVERSAVAVVGILGVLLAGGAWVALDPRAPRQRIERQLELCGARIVLTSKKNRAALGRAARGRQLLAVEAQGLDAPGTLGARSGKPRAGKPRAGKPRASAANLSAAHLAYVLFTSGSSGEPKGVAVEHRQLTAYLEGVRQRLGVGGPTDWLLVLPLFVDAAMTPLWLPLTSGGRVVILDEEEAADPRRLAAALAEVDGLKIAPGHLATLEKAAGRRLLPRNFLVLGGEAVESRWSAGLAAEAGAGRTVLNEYGPTESTVGTLAERLLPGRGAASLPVALGRPLAGARAFITDRRLRLVPPGVAGELVLGGATLARGYPGRPAATAALFVPDPFSDDPGCGARGARLYRSGDVARQRGDGRFDFLGRRDRQLKIRGFRVEPGEIEAALLAHPAVAGARVAAQRGASGHARLVAGVKVPGKGVTAGELREFLRRRLPPGLLPATLEVVEEWPRDGWKTRPEPTSGRGREPEEEGYTAPAGEREELLARIWKRVLGVARVGAHDDFFALGGDSILGLRIAAAARRHGLALMPRDLFEHPTVARLARAARREKSVPSLAPRPHVSPRRSGSRDTAPLTPLQEGLLYQSRVESRAPAHPAYLEQWRWEISGDFDAGSWRHAWSELAERHAALRAAVTWQRETPLFAVRRPGELALPWSEIDATALPRASRDAWLAGWLAADRRRGFDLERPPLWRAAVVFLGEGRWCFAWTFHHLILDGWSSALLLSEAAKLERAARRGRRARLPAPPPSATLMTEWARRAAAINVRQVWATLLGDPPPRDAPGRLATAAEPSAIGGRAAGRERRLPWAASEALRALGRRSGTTLGTLLAAAWAFTLGRETGSREALFGFTVAGRPADLPGAERAVGCFVNTLPLLLGMGENGTPTLEYLRRVQEKLLAARRFEHASLAALQRAAPAVLGGAGGGLFDTLLAVESYPPVSEEPSFSFKGPRVVSRTHYPLTLTVQPGAQIALTATHDPARLDESCAARLLRRLGRVLESLPKAATLAAVEITTAAERHQCLHEWGTSPEPVAAPGATSATAAGTVLAAVEAWARLSPFAPALAFQGASLSYGELARRAARLARGLRARGITRGERIGLDVGRTPARSVAILGILRAGAVCVPLDPALPPRRRAGVAERARLVSILDEAEVAKLIAQPVLTALPALPGADDAVYAVFTSGTTGRPKGILMTHGPFARLVAWYASSGFGGRVLSFAALGFDVAFLEAFLAWSTGGCLCLAPEAARSNPEKLGDHLASERIETAFLAPSLLRHLARACPVQPAPRRIVATGEELRLTPALAGWIARNGLELHDHYGPAETHVVTARAVECDVHLPRRASIGRPVAGARVRIVDRRGHLAAPGAAGEIWIGGQLARGYLGRAATAARFVPDPWSTVPGQRLFRSGDRARHLDDGSLEYLGRLDRQLQVRGVRTEPREIELALLEHPAVEAAAVVSSRAEEEPRLVAWLVDRDATPPPTDKALRAHLRERLPEAMLPAVFVWLPELPLTVHHKIDLAALEQREVPARERDGPTPSWTVSALAETLAAVWSQVLGKTIEPTDDVLARGGHSLHVGRVALRLAELCGVEAPLAWFFELPVPLQLASRLESRLGAATPEADAADATNAADATDAADAAAATETARPPAEAPLSFAQERLFFLQQLDPASPAHHLPFAWHLEGPLDDASLARALSAVAHRHGALRTTFQQAEGGPRQRFGAVPRPLPRHVDLSRLTASARSHRLERDLAVIARLPFTLDQEPPWRAVLLRLHGAEHVLAIVAHHLVFDGWSEAIFLRELGIFYDNPPPPALAPPTQYPPPQYPALTARERRTATTKDRLEWWRQRLEPLPPPLDLGFDRPRRAPPAPAGELVELRFTDGLEPRLAQLAREASASLFMALVAAIWSVFGRLSGQQRILLGTPAASRPRRDLEKSIGLFLETLVLAGDLGDGPSFRQLVERGRDATFGALDNRLPFERLVEALAPPRDARVSPLFQVLFAFHNAPPPHLELRGVKSRPCRKWPITVRFDLELDLEIEDGRLRGTLAYRRSLFDRTSVARLARRLEIFLAAAARNPERRVEDLAWMSAFEEHQLRVEWPDGGTLGELARGDLFERIAARARQAPGALAILDDASGRRLRYGELIGRARGLAAELRRRGVGEETPVGLFAERTPELIVGILAVLAAGGAWVPLDPEAPPERLHACLRRSGARLVLTRRTPRPPWPPGAAELVDLDFESMAVFNVPVSNVPAASCELPKATVCGSAAAYLIFTSGTTGDPKGVVTSRRSLLHHLLFLQEHFRLAPGEGVLHKTPIDFDVSVWEVLWPLLAGARLVLARPGGHRDPRYLARVLRRHEISTVHFVPSVLDLFVDELTAGAGASLRRVLASGESLPAALAERTAQRLAAPLFNLYGPTEATIDVSAGRAVPVLGATGRTVPIGRPVAGSCLRVLDGALRPRPVGGVGELHLGGVQLARGYTGDPAGTAAAFIPDPFAGRGKRLFRSGDLARWRADGTLELLGRRDRQLKIRGVRIEPAEVEAVLRRHQSVERAAVAVAGQGDKRHLVAWVAGKEGLTAPTLLAWARARLPRAAVPKAVAVGGAPPLSSAGKLDAEALARRAARGSGNTTALPRHAAERVMAELWSAVLDRDNLGPDDDFFELGGHSLLAARIAALLRRDFQVDLPLALFFERPTLGALAAELAASWPERAAFPLTRAPRDAPPVLSFAQRRLFFLHLLSPGDGTWHLPAQDLLEGPLDPAALDAAVAALFARHEILRTRITTPSGVPTARIEPPETGNRAGWRLLRVDLGGLPPARRQAAAARVHERAWRRPLDLERGPVARFILLRFADGRHELSRVLHHVAADATSEAILDADLAALYAAARERRTPELPALAARYADFAATERAVLNGTELERRLAFWRRYLAAAPRLDLPLDRPRPALLSSTANEHRLVLDASLTAALRQRGGDAGASLFMTLTTGLVALLSRLSNQDDLVLGTPAVHRPWPELEGVVGPFLNSLALRFDLGGDPTLAELLRRVRRASLDAFAHQDVPFDRVVEALSPERDLGRTPLFETTLTFHARPRATPAWPGLERQSVEPPALAVRHDLELALGEEDEGLRGAWTFRRDLFDAVTVERWSRWLLETWRMLAESPRRRLSDLGVSSLAERRQVIAPKPRPSASGAPRSTPEKLLAETWSALLGREVSDRGADYFVLGGDSLLAIQMLARARQAGYELRLRDVFRHPTLAAMAAAMQPAPTTPRPSPVPRQEEEAASALTPIQHFFFAWGPAEPWHFNQAFVFELARRLAPSFLARGVTTLVARHPALRTSFSPHHGRWRAAIHPPAGMPPLAVIDLSAVPRQARESAWTRAVDRLQRGFDLPRGVLFRAALFDLGASRPGRLWMGAHHLAVDLASWPILLQELESLYRRPQNALPAPGPTCGEWAQRLARWTRSRSGRDELEYWPGWERCATPLRRDQAGDANRVGDAATVTLRLDAAPSQRLLEAPAAGKIPGIVTLLLTALARVLTAYNDVPRLAVDLEGHGREALFEDLDPSRTVGWLTALFPVGLDLGGARDPKQALDAVREILARIPGRGVGWGALRYLGPPESVRRLAALPRREILVHYLGRRRTLTGAPSPARLFQPSAISPGPSHSPRGTRSHLFEIYAALDEDAPGEVRLVVDWIYSRHHHRAATVERLGQRLATELEILARG